MKPLPRRRLGTNDPEITTVGFGAWAVGGGGWSFAWGAQDDAMSVVAIQHAVSLGVSWIDTAAVYGLGHSEEVVGRAIADIPRAERPLVFTKCGLRWNENDPMAVSARDSSPARIREECEASLRRLGVEAIDLYQFHWPDQSGTPLADSWGELMKLQDQGKVRYVGVSNYTTALLEGCEKLRHVQSLQPPFSLIRRDMAATELPWCRAHGTGVIVYSPMQSGLLTDGFTAERVAAMPEDDWRRRAPYFQEPNLARNLALRDALRPIARKHGVNVGAVAVAWTLAWSGITGAIVGARGPEQVDGWIQGGALQLDASDLDEIARAIERTGAGSGPLRLRVSEPADPFPAHYDALEARHRAELTFAEVRRALQALSSLYVERREGIALGKALEGRGKRAAFALYYGPLHFLLVRAIVRALSFEPPARIVDLGCGTGSAGAAWALERRPPASVAGVDANGWAVAEARWTLKQLGVPGTATHGDAVAERAADRGAGLLAAFTVNELSDDGRARLLARVREAGSARAPVLIVEPISRRVSPWWPAWRDAFLGAGGREDEWRFRPALPQPLALLGKAAGLDARELVGRSLALPGSARGGG